MWDSYGLQLMEARVVLRRDGLRGAPAPSVPGPGLPDPHRSEGTSMTYPPGPHGPLWNSHTGRSASARALRSKSRTASGRHRW